LEIQTAITGIPIDQLVQQYRGKLYGHLKVDTGALVIEALQPIQARTKELLADKGELLAILRQGAAEARQVAEATLRRVYDRVGFLRL